jgi:hypothetical protein
VRDRIGLKRILHDLAVVRGSTVVDVFRGPSLPTSSARHREACLGIENVQRRARYDVGAVAALPVASTAGSPEPTTYHELAAGIDGLADCRIDHDWPTDFSTAVAPMAMSP